MRSEFIGIVEILQTSEGQSDQRYYLADLKVIESFKGTAPDRIRVSGTTSEVYSGQCEISVKEGEQWLIFINEADESYYLSHCSHPVKVTNKNDRQEKLTDIEKNELEQLRFFRENVPNLNSEKIIEPDQVKLWKFLQQFNGKYFETHTTYYLLDFNTELQVLDIKTLQGFSDAVDTKIKDYLKNEAGWQVGYLWDKAESLDKKTQYIFTLHYNSSDSSVSRVKF